MVNLSEDILHLDISLFGFQTLIDPMKALQYILIQMQTKQLKPQQTEAACHKSRIYHFLA